MFATTHAAGNGTNDFAEAVAIDRGQIFLAGRVDDDIWIGSASVGGDLIWEVPFSGDNPSANYWASSVVRVDDSRIVVSSNPDLSEAMPGYLISLDHDGEDMSVQRVAGPVDANGNGMLLDLHAALLPDGDLVLAAATFERSMVKGWVSRRQSDGTSEWGLSFDGPDADSNVRVADIDVDDAGDIVITADWPTSTADGIDIMVRRYDAEGAERWTSIYSGPTNGSDQAGGVAVDRLGNVYLHGSSEVGASDHDMVARKLSPEGETVWTETWSGNPDEPFNHDYGADVEISPRGLVVLLGYTYSESTNYDVFVRMIAP